MKYIAFNSADLSISVTDKRQPELKNIRVSNSDGRRASDPVSDKILSEVLYPEIKKRDKRSGRNVAYCLAHPDPWLVALGLVMWEGIIQGLSWDIVKLAVQQAMRVMSFSNVAPTNTTTAIKKRAKTEIGYRYTEYSKGRKQYSMFLGLRRHYDSRSSKK